MILFAGNEGTDQTARMRRLIWAVAGRICPKTRFRMLRPTLFEVLTSQQGNFQEQKFEEIQYKKAICPLNVFKVRGIVTMLIKPATQNCKKVHSRDTKGFILTDNEDSDQLMCKLAWVF